MRNEVCVIEIKNKSLRLLIGYLQEDKIKVVYRLKKQLTVGLNDGDVLDVGSLTSDLQSVSKIDDKELNFKYLIKEAILVIPSFGLEVYNNSQSTNIISSEGIIETIDVKNVHSLMEKIKFPNENNMLVNIIPNSFTIADHRPYLTAPLGLKSPFINLNANLYTLPKKFVADLYRAFSNANITIKKAYISSLCSTEALKKNDFKYQRFMMVQIGSKNSIVTLVDKQKVVASTYFSLGGDDLTKQIAAEFQIPMSEAERIKKVYGLESGNHSYNPVLAKSTVETPGVVCNRMTLNAVIQKFIKELSSQLINSMRVLLNGRDDYVDKIPLIMFGNTMKLKGLKESLMRTFLNNTIEVPASNIVGVSYNDYINEVGAIYLDRDLEKNFQNETGPSTKNNSLLTREVE